MGTRSEIYVRNPDGETIELWKHFDGYPEYMVPFFKAFAKWARNLVGTATHWLTYSPDVAALLIAFDYDLHKQEQKKRGLPSEYARPDVRPRGGIEDAEYVWILELPPVNTEPPVAWVLRGYKLSWFSLGPAAPEVRQAIREGKDILREFPNVIARKVAEERIEVAKSRKETEAGFREMEIVAPQPKEWGYDAASLERLVPIAGGRVSRERMGAAEALETGVEHE